jgi:hypothetical protein
MASELRSCECPGLFKPFCSGQQVRREPPSPDIVPVEVNARPAIGEEDFVTAELGDGFMFAECERGRLSSVFNCLFGLGFILTAPFFRWAPVYRAFLSRKEAEELGPTPG